MSRHIFFFRCSWSSYSSPRWVTQQEVSRGRWIDTSARGKEHNQVRSWPTQKPLMSHRKIQVARAKRWVPEREMTMLSTGRLLTSLKREERQPATQGPLGRGSAWPKEFRRLLVSGSLPCLKEDPQRWKGGFSSIFYLLSAAQTSGNIWTLLCLLLAYIFPWIMAYLRGCPEAYKSNYLRKINKMDWRVCILVTLLNRSGVV